MVSTFLHLSLSLLNLMVVKGNFTRKLQIISKSYENKLHYADFLPKRLHWNGNTIGIRPQIQKLE